MNVPNKPVSRAVTIRQYLCFAFLALVAAFPAIKLAYDFIVGVEFPSSHHFGYRGSTHLPACATTGLPTQNCNFVVKRAVGVVELPARFSRLVRPEVGGLDRDRLGLEVTTIARHMEKSATLLQRNLWTTRASVAYLYRGIAALGLGEREQALTDIQLARDTWLNRITRFARGEAFRLSGARRLGHRCLFRDCRGLPSFSACSVPRGQAYFDKGEYDRAMGDWQRAVRLSWDCPSLYSLRGKGDPADLSALKLGVKQWDLDMLRKTRFDRLRHERHPN